LHLKNRSLFVYNSFYYEGWQGLSNKDSIEYHTKGAFFEDMKRWNPKHRPGNAAAVLKVEKVYAGAEKLL
jgi:hypothetical protein